MRQQNLNNTAGTPDYHPVDSHNALSSRKSPPPPPQPSSSSSPSTTTTTTTTTAPLNRNAGLKEDEKMTQQHSSSSSPSPSPPLRTIEIQEGIELPLRGSQETQDAIDADFLVGPIACTCCTVEIFCIRDAEFILCPVCLSLTPLEVSELKHPKAYGVGLGFTLDS